MKSWTVTAPWEREVCIGDCSVQQCAAQKMEIPDFDLEVKTRSGERLWVNVSTLVFDEPRRNRHLVVHLARDISHRKKSEELLAKMLEISKEMVAVADHNTRVAPVSPLSEQEQRILRLFAKAKNSSEIARELGITLPNACGIIYTASTRSFVLTTAWKL